MSDEVLWGVALVVGVVVIGVVAFLLELIVRTAREIQEVVGSIWTVGKQIAANTVTIALLNETNHLAGALLGSAGKIHQASERIRLSAAGGRS